jgi:hypothetical protein
MEPAEITYFFENFCNRNTTAFANGEQDRVRRDCKFLHDLVTQFPNANDVTTYTQIFTQDIEWTRPMNHQYAINGLTQYFSRYYDIFKIIQYTLTSEQFITLEQHDALFALTNSPQTMTRIYTYLINKQLYEIYAKWKDSPQYTKDAVTIHNKIAEIHSANNIPSNFPDIQQIANNPALLDPKQSWRTLLQTPVLTDDFLVHIKIWRFLSDYSVMISLPVTPTRDMARPLLGAPERKKKKAIPAALKRKVWAKWLGEETGKAKCLCCNLTDITQLNFHCGHIISEAEGGELKVDNLKPICQSCNSSMGTTNMEEFMKKYGF